MASFLFLTPPGRAEGDERTVAVRDGFCFLAFLFPPLWFLSYRMWFEALAAALLLGLAAALSATGHFGPAGPALSFAVCLFCGFEGGNLLVRQFERRGYRLAAAVEARNLAAAEEIFFSNAALRTRRPVNSGPPDLATTGFAPTGRPAADHRPVLGLFDLHGGR